MKKLTVFIDIILFIAICVFGLHFCLKEMLVDTVAQGGVSSALSQRMMDIVFEQFPDADINALSDIQKSIENSKVINDITSQYIDEMTQAIVQQEKVSFPNISADLDQLIDENIDLIEEKMKVQLDEEKVKELKEKLEDRSHDFTSTLQNYSESLMNQPSSAKTTLMKVYAAFDSMTFLVVTFIVICLLAILIYFINHSFKIAVINIGVTTLISGLFYAFILPKLTSRMIMNLTNRYLGRTMMIETSSLFSIGMIISLIGIILLIIYLILRKGELKKAKYTF